MNTSITLREARKIYGHLGISITKKNNYYQAESKKTELFMQSDRIDLLCQALFRFTLKMH